MNDKRLEHEIAHGKKIKENAEDVWGWSSPAGQIRAKRRANWFIDLGKFKPGDQVLEVGCGTGLFTEMVYEKTKANIVATDLVDDLLEVARKKYPDITFKAEDAMNMSFADNSFVGIFGSSILHHLEFEKSLTEFLRVLKPGGRMIFAEPNMLNPQIMIQKNIPYIKEKLGDSPDETAIVRWSYKRLMEKLGYVNVRIFPYDFLHPATPKAMIGLVNGIGMLVEKTPLLKEIAGSVVIYGEKKA